ncbi:hypothetical protein BDV18DRAFT_158065 [Aspergillus unguis]
MTAQCPPTQPTDAFRDLSRIFSSRDDRVLEFEILPPAFGPLLEDGDSIGIAKKYLVQAFVIARRVFFDGINKDSNPAGTSKDTKLNPSLTGQTPQAEVDVKLATASEIILLFDCEHLTACNWRKRRLAALSTSEEQYIQALEVELSLMTTYLCSPLHRHTKSPTLWQHRQWIQSQLLRLRRPGLQAARGLFLVELSVALRAGELHPRNYYAFTYMRQMHRILSELGSDSEDWSVHLGQPTVEPTLDWCLAHPSDISSLMFLLYLLDTIPDSALRLNVVEKVVGFAIDIGWEGESIWTFVDLGIRRFNLLESLGGAPAFPWSVLRSASDDSSEDYTTKTWKAWLDKARVHWARSKCAD